MFFKKKKVSIQGDGNIVNNSIQVASTESGSITQINSTRVKGGNATVCNITINGSSIDEGFNEKLFKAEYTNDVLMYGTYKGKPAVVFKNRDCDLYGNLKGNLNTTSIKGNINCDVSGNVNGSISGAVNGNIRGSINGNIGGTVNGSISGSLNGNIRGSFNGRSM